MCMPRRFFFSVGQNLSKCGARHKSHRLKSLFYPWINIIFNLTLFVTGWEKTKEAPNKVNFH